MLGAKAENPEEILEPLDAGKLIFARKFRDWKIFYDDCGYRIQGLCLLEGHACCFKLCPMRIFEEGMDEIKSERIRQLKDQVSRLKQKVKELEEQLKKTP